MTAPSVAAVQTALVSGPCRHISALKSGPSNGRISGVAFVPLLILAVVRVFFGSTNRESAHSACSHDDLRVPIITRPMSMVCVARMT